MAFVRPFSFTSFFTNSSSTSISPTRRSSRNDPITPISRSYQLDFEKPVLAKRRITAVLDTPASNTYLQRHAELTLRDFLTRRAVNTVMYYMRELGQGVTYHWLSQFENFSDKVKQHKFKDGDSFLERLSRAPTENFVMKVGYPNGRFSRKIHCTIEPGKLAGQISDVRVQLSKEWARDLRCIDAENLELQRLSFERMVVSNEKELDSKRNLIFDSGGFGNDQTPLRYKNYIALKTLITQHAVARLLPYMRDQGSNHEYMYLLQFINLYGVIENGDHFLSCLMIKPPVVRTIPEFTVVPKILACQILELRSAIAAEWISVMEFVPVEQDVNMRRQLERTMDPSNDLSDDMGNRNYS